MDQSDGRLVFQTYFQWISFYGDIFMNQTPINNIEHLREKIITTCATLDPNSIIAATHSNLIKRAELCVAERKKQFEHLLT